MKFKRFPHRRTHTVKNKPFEIYWSKRAEGAFQKRQTPLLVEMQLKFACMVRMNVIFHEHIEHANSIPISDKLSVLYRPVAGQSCGLEDISGQHDGGELTSGPMANRFPKELGIDFVRGKWLGRYS